MAFNQRGEKNEQGGENYPPIFRPADATFVPRLNLRARQDNPVNLAFC